MNTLLTMSEIKGLVDQELDRLFVQYEEKAAVVGAEYARLIREISRLVRRGGKRLRPYLAYLTYMGKGGSNLEDIIPTMLSVELCHSFLLIHDDCIDHDYVRYGGPTIAARYKEMGYESLRADSVALLAGDVTYTMALSCLNDSRLINLVYDAMFHTLGGELMEIPRYKTAEYSFCLPMKMGVMAAGQTDNIEDFAIPWGNAYQLRDDWLGTFGDEQVLGKSVLSDLQEGKETLLCLFALEHALEKDRVRLKSWHGNPAVTYANLEIVRDIYVRSVAEQHIFQEIDRLTQEARTRLPGLELSKPAEVALENLIQNLTNREK